MMLITAGHKIFKEVTSQVNGISSTFLLQREVIKCLSS